MPVTFISGNGGYLLVGTTPVRLEVKQWTLKNAVRDVENTHSGTGGFTNFEPVVRAPEWTAEGPLDIENLPDVDAGLASGTKATVKFFEGASGKFITLTNTYIGELEVINDNQSDIARWRASGKGCTAMTNHVT